jgi:hypothetical protein
LDSTISPDLITLYDILVSTVMGLSLVRAALKNSAVGGILESTRTPSPYTVTMIRPLLRPERKG